MNMPSKARWDETSRRCYERLLVLFVLLVTFYVVVYAPSIPDVLGFALTAISLLAIALLTFAYFTRRDDSIYDGTADICRYS